MRSPFFVILRPLRESSPGNPTLSSFEINPVGGSTCCWARERESALPKLVWLRDLVNAMFRNEEYKIRVKHFGVNSWPGGCRQLYVTIFMGN